MFPASPRITLAPARPFLTDGGACVQAQNNQLSADGESQATAQEVGAAFKENYKGAFPNLTIYSDHKEMLAKEGPLDIVTVGVSDHRHADIVVDAANAGVKGIFCEKPLATTLEDTDRMVEACEANGVILSVDHTRRFLPIWRYCKEQIVDKGEIGEVQYIISRLHGPRSMMCALPLPPHAPPRPPPTSGSGWGRWRNGTHNIDVMLWFAGAKPKWVMGDFEDGYAEYDRVSTQALDPVRRRLLLLRSLRLRGPVQYGQRGMDGGKDPALEPATNGYIAFENGVKGFFIGGSKKTPTNIKMEVEIVGDSGRLVIDNAGDVSGRHHCALRHVRTSLDA